MNGKRGDSGGGSGDVGERPAGEGSADEKRGISELFDELEELEDVVDAEHEREHVRDAMHAAREAQESVVFGRVVWGFDRADFAEALLGALLFGIPMAVESGTNEAGEFLARHPLLLVGTAAGTVAVVVGILYVAEIQDVRIADAFFGVIPHRLVGVLATSAVTAVVLLTAWGRIAWDEPVVAAATCVVATVPMAVGAALGDILPGS